ncbi:Stf0 family sulfotransferase [Micromonospora sp. CPCC 205711]|uniref:Stf0 family sulfotransferase n=1 Tax=Micromonospora sp. CPCC 205547 TaxID=3122400 RepID=UPI002FEF7976
MTTVDTYVVCATPRTGSSLLLGLLDSTGVAGHPQAYFRAPDEPLWADRWGIPRRPDGGFDYADYVRAALAAGRTANGVFGAKLMWGTLDEVLEKLAPVHPDLAGDDLRLWERAFGRTRFVHLRRDDVLAQAVSWARAEQTGQWFVGGNGEIGGGGATGQAPRFDPAAIEAYARLASAHDAGWRRWFAAHDVRPHPVRYEDLAADPAGVTRGVLDFLGLELPAGRVVTARHRRQADDVNREWAERYRSRAADAHPG